MADAVAFQRMKAFVIEEGFDKGVAGRIALEHRRKVGANRCADPGVVRQGFFKGLARQQRIKIAAAQLARQMIGERVFQPVMLEDGGVNEAGQSRLFRGHGLGLGAQLRPDRIDALQFFASDRHGSTFSTEICTFSKRQA